MIDFYDQTDIELKASLSQTNSRELIDFIHRLEKKKQNIFSKRIKIILGKEYYKMIKIAIKNYKDLS
jgi:hypothetical protein